jgi:hypothetical protein
MKAPTKESAFVSVNAAVKLVEPEDTVNAAKVLSSGATSFTPVNDIIPTVVS